MKQTGANPKKAEPPDTRPRNAWFEIMAGIELFFAGCFLLAASTFVNPSWREVFAFPFRDPDIVGFALAWGSLFLLAAGLLLVSAVGLFFHKQWARDLTILLAWFFLVLGFAVFPLSIFLDLDEMLPVELDPFMPSWTIICLIDSLLCIVFSGIALRVFLPNKTRAYFR